MRLNGTGGTNDDGWIWHDGRHGLARAPAYGAVLDRRHPAGGLGPQQRVSEPPAGGRAGRGGDSEAPLRAGGDQPRRICAGQRNAARIYEVNAMKYRWMGITGLALILASLFLGSLGPSLWPRAFWSSQYSAMMSGGMMGGGPMGPGMMNGGMMGAGAITNPAASFDQRFLDQMIVHHQGAVMSAQMMIADSARPELRDLAQRIITGQQREIDQMRQWRQDWYGTVANGTLLGMMNGGMTGAAMMNREQMRQMMGANADFDRMFLQMMIPHHEAAIAMAQQALAQAEHAEIKTLAQGIITTQRAEVGEMQRYLQ